MKNIFKDPSTSNPPMWRYMGCVLIRTFLGLSLILNRFDAKYLIIIAVFAVALFTLKFVRYPNVWKNYARTVIVYLIAGLLSVFSPNTYNREIGTLIIVDALMGLQSRHIIEKI